MTDKARTGDGYLAKLSWLRDLFLGDFRDSGYHRKCKDMYTNVSATARPKAGRLLKWFPVLVVGGAGVLGVIGLLWLWRGKPPSMAAAYWSLISFAAMVLYLVAESFRPSNPWFAAWLKLPLLVRAALPIGVGAVTLYFGLQTCAKQ